MTFYVIRHKTTQELMPQSIRKSGYTHWNPSVKETSRDYFLNVPRLFYEKRKASLAASQWFHNPNLARRPNDDNPKNFNLELRIKNDGRKKDDIEIIEVELVLKETTNGSQSSHSSLHPRRWSHY